MITLIEEAATGQQIDRYGVLYILVKKRKKNCMSLWERKFEGNMFSADESYFWGRYPQQVAKAFIAVGYDDSNPNDEGGSGGPILT